MKNQTNDNNERTYMSIEEFRQWYCFACGSLQCTREDEWLEACPHYREKVKQHKTQDNEYYDHNHEIL